MINKTKNYLNSLKKIKKACSLKELCEYDINEKSKKYGLSQEETEKLIDELKKSNYINEERYCQAYINDKIKYNRWGKNKIRYTLKNKGINHYLINDKLENTDTDFYEKIVSSEIKKKANSLKKEKDYLVKKQKLIRFCYQRGYESEICESIIKNIID